MIHRKVKLNKTYFPVNFATFRQQGIFGLFGFKFILSIKYLKNIKEINDMSLKATKNSSFYLPCNKQFLAGFDIVHLINKTLVRPIVEYADCSVMSSSGFTSE